MPAEQLIYIKGPLLPPTCKFSKFAHIKFMQMCSAVLELWRANRQNALGRTLEISLSKGLKLSVSAEEISVAENCGMIFVASVPASI